MNNEEKIKFLEDYKKSLEGKTLEELKAIEVEVIAEADAIDKETAECEFNLPKENYSVVAEAIRTLLNKQTVEWRFTLGLVSMYEFWNPDVNPKKVKYPMLDSTLRTLGGMQFTGYIEWAAVVAINKYFEECRTAYVDQTEKIYDIAAKHNTIIDAIKLLEPINDIPDAVTVE